ncbi:MAG: M50 family metallopeptidase [Cellulomonadaceae bacterium]
MLDVLERIWENATTALAPPSPQLAVVTAAIALAVVLWRPAWSVGRHAITIVHEAGHGVVAVLCGRRLSGIRLHSDTSGLTVSVGRPRGPGMVATAVAGYCAPGIVGLGAAALLARGYAIGVLWALAVVLALVLVQIRNWFGLWSVLVCGAGLVAVSWWGSHGLATAVAYAVSWFLLLGSPRPVLELQAERRRGGARRSDADMLARLTPLPGLVWVVVFALVTVGCAALGAWWLLEPVLAAA